MAATVPCIISPWGKEKPVSIIDPLHWEELEAQKDTLILMTTCG